MIRVYRNNWSPKAKQITAAQGPEIIQDYGK